MPTIIDRTLSVGLLHAAASAVLIRRAMALHQQQGMKLRHEAKQAFTRFFEDYNRMQRSYERVQGIATDKNVDEDTGRPFDTFLSDSGTLAMISMLYFNATNESNPNWERNSKDILNVLRNLTLATTDPIFSLEYINKFAPKV